MGELGTQLTIFSLEVLDALEKTKGIGITAKQLSRKLNMPEDQVEDSLRQLEGIGKAVRVGRGLWVDKRYQDLENVPDFVGPEDYIQSFTKKYGISLQEDKQEINTTSNLNDPVHRWARIIQGFSSSFVNSTLDRYGINQGANVLDPFLGCGTVAVCAKMRGMNAIGVDMFPLFAFMSKVKTTWDLDIKKIQRAKESLKPRSRAPATAPRFLSSETQFKKEVLRNLLKLKQAISSVDDPKIRDLFRLAFASILIPCSNLERSPCLGYAKKNIKDSAPFELFEEEINKMIEDLKYVQSRAVGSAMIILGDSRQVSYAPEAIDIAITSPPYMSGLDYVINYKIEMAWLDLVESYEELGKLKDKMVVCDNVTRGLIRRFSKKEQIYSNEWLDDIVRRLSAKMKLKGSYRRNDMHLVVQKYFDDLYPVFKKVYVGLKRGGRFVIVIGDSLIATVYIPTDLILASMGEEVGFTIEEIRIARRRRSGQRTGFTLRESIVTLRK